MPRFELREQTIDWSRKINVFFQELEDKIRYTSYTGRKDRLENLAFLPRTLVGINDDGTPRFAQWNYRILCHPLKEDLPLGNHSVSAHR